jgi:hypothetical protein
MLMTREEFRDWLFDNEFHRNKSLIQQHHTWLTDYSDVHEVGWDNIAQYITTFPDGKVAISRPFDIPPGCSVGEEANLKGIKIENL